MNITKETNLDTKINELFEVLNKQKKIVEDAELETKQSWKTTCSFQVQGMNTPINIQTISESNLVSLLSDILQRKEYIAEAYQMLGVESKDNKINGFEFDDWLSDFRKRMAIINIKEKKEKLVLLESRLNAVVSPEQRRLMEIEAITKSLL